MSEEDATVEITYEKALSLVQGSKVISTHYYGPKFKEYLEIPSHVKVEKDGEIKEYTVIQIGDHTFDGNDSITSIIIPNTVKNIEAFSFKGCSGLTSVTIPSSVTSIGESAFYGCTGLTTVTIPNSVTSIANWAFRECTGLTSVNYEAENVTGPTQSSYAWFTNCTNIITFIIGNTVKSIPDDLCYGLSKIQSITIPNSVTSIGDSAFWECTGLTSVNYEAENVTGPSALSDAWFSGCSNITTFIIGETVKSIPAYLCYGLSKIQSIAIPNSVTSIGGYAFSYCPGLTSINIPNSVTSIGEYAFSGCTGLTSVEIPNSIIFIPRYCFAACTGLTSVKIPNSVTDIGYYAFQGCKNAIIEAYLKACKSLIDHSSSHDWSSLNLIGSPVYYVSKYNTKQESIDFWITLFHYQYAPEDSMNTEAVESGIYYNRNYYSCNSNGKVTINGLKINTSYTFSMYTKYSDGTILTPLSYKLTTYSLNTRVAKQEITPTSLTVKFSYKLDDAEFKSDYITYNGENIPGQKLSLSGLKPNTTYSAKYTVTTKGGSTETRNYSFTTPALELKMLTPYSVTSTNTIVAAETNMSNQETSAGFQWKKYDAPSTLAPKEAFAAIYDGRLEGYIKNLQSTSYYNVRAFYKDATGNYTYSDWVTFDPSDFSYFEPTVHTYPTNEVSASSATVKGYVLPGSDEILKQGIEYWKVGAANAPMKVMSPMAASAKDTVFATGQVMIVTLNNLKPSTDYCYRAFVTTQAGTTYGEEQTFTTGFGVGDVNADGVVNVSDVTALVNKILQAADTFESVCDVNADGVVNVSDVTTLVNIILNNSSAAKKHAIEAGIQSAEPIVPVTSVAATAIQAL